MALWNQPRSLEQLRCLRDESLCREVTQGNQEAFLVLFDRYWPPVFRLAYGVIRDEAEAEDLAQALFLEVHASMQPFHLCIGGCPEPGNVWADNLGPARLRHAMTWHELAAARARLAFGSDWPVASLNPFLAIQTAITRKDFRGLPSGGWHPEQKLTLEQALAGYTREAAHAAFLDSRVGSLEPEKSADLIALSQNLFEVLPLDISKTKVELTMVGGCIVYRAERKDRGDTPKLKRRVRAGSQLLLNISGSRRCFPPAALPLHHT